MEGLPFQPWAAELQKKRAAAFSKDNPDGLCLPESTLQLHLDPQPLKAVLEAHKGRVASIPDS